MQRKIIFFLGGMRRGGAERVFTILSKGFLDRGYAVSVCVLLFNEWEYAIDERIEKVDFSGNTQSRIKRTPYWLNNIRKYVKKENPYVVISFAARINALVQLACVGLKTAIIVSERSDPWHDGRELPIKILNNIFYPKAKKVVLQTEKSKQYFCKKVQKNCVVIRNPISVDAEASKTPRAKIVTVGRLSLEKNQEMLIRAFSKIKEKHPEYELWIYGQGPLRGILVNLIQVLNLEDSVFLPGMKENIHKEILDAEIFVLTSDYEGLSNALMEAMMMGLPCISTRCGGAEELIEDGISGLLIPVGDMEALINAIERVVDENDLAESLSENAKMKSREFSTNIIINKWGTVLLGL